MFQNKKQIKLTILLLISVIFISQISLFSLVKTEVYLSLYDNPQIFSTTSPKPEVRAININITSQDELIKVLQISESLAQKIITLRDSLSGGFKEPKDLLQLPEITNLEWKEWKEEGIIIIVN